LNEQHHRRLRCLGHIINLISKAILLGENVSSFEEALQNAGDDKQFELWAKKGPLGRAHNFVVFVNRSGLRLELFRSLQEKQFNKYGNAVLFYNLVADGGVRWNATYLMIQRLNKLEDTVDLFVKRIRDQDESLPSNKRSGFGEKHEIRREDWKALRDIEILLLPLYQLTLHLEGYAQQGCGGTIAEVLPCLTLLYQHLRTKDREVNNPAFPDLLNPDTEHGYQIGVKLGLTKCKEYLDICRQIPTCCMAAVLDPRMKLAYFFEVWHTKLAEPEWNKELKATGTRFWEAFKTTQPSIPLPPEVADPIEENMLLAHILPKKKPRGDEYITYVQPDRLADKDVNLFEWWTEKQTTWPILSRLAFNLLSAPAMSAECERVFSSTKKMITPERNHLKADVIEAQECLKSWIKHGITDITAADCLLLNYKEGNRLFNEVSILN